MRNNDRKGKWQPFDALSGFRKSIEEVNYKQEKVAKPLLSVDKQEQINNNLTEALEYDYEIIIKYYIDGYIYNLEGKIKKIDLVSRSIKIAQKTISLINIVDVIIK